MSDKHDSHDLSRQVKVYLTVASALVVFTLINVGASFLHIENSGATICIALLISCIEAFLVAGYMMHLFSEKRVIYGIMIATVFFFFVLMLVIHWATSPENRLGH